MILEEEGFSVREAEYGLRGIELILGERPDLIFLDLCMPGINGVETLCRLKAVDATLTIYIVTAFAKEYMDQLKSVNEEGLRFELAGKPLSSAQIRYIAPSVVTPILRKKGPGSSGTINALKCCNLQFAQ
jgi:CheY-like chemotaxis protein